MYEILKTLSIHVLTTFKRYINEDITVIDKENIINGYLFGARLDYIKQLKESKAKSLVDLKGHGFSEANIRKIKDVLNKHFTE